MIYLIGSLRNAEVPNIANKLREAGHEVFDDWYAAGPEADDKWRDYERGRGRSYIEALAGSAARNVFAFDKRHLDRATDVVLILPAGKSGHLELGYSLGRGKRGYILLDNPDRWDVMYQFADGIFYSVEELITCLESITDITETSQKTPSTLEDQPDGVIHSNYVFPQIGKEFLKRIESGSTPIHKTPSVPKSKGT